MTNPMKPFSILALVMLAGCGAEAEGPLHTPMPKQPRQEMDRIMYLYVDPLNGCQYLHSMQGGITPRLNPDGTQVCTRKETE
jgi:predicted small lipoprotein YifL